MKKEKNKRRSAWGRSVIGLLLPVCLLLLLAGCGSGGQSGASSAAISDSADMIAADGIRQESLIAETTAAAAAEGEALFAIPGTIERMDSAAQPVDGDSSEVQGDSGKVQGETDSGEAAETEEESGAAAEARKLIRTVHVNAQTTEYDRVTAQLKNRVEELGGYIERSASQGNSDTERGGRYIDFTARIPSDKVDEFLRTAFEGASIVYQSENTEDVTLRYSDLSARLTALRTEQTRLTELLAEADSIESVIALESRLSEVRYELESIASQLRLYDNQVSYSTVNVNLAEVHLLAAGAEEGFFAKVQAGFRKNAADVTQSASALLIWILSHLPMMIVVALIALFGYSITKIVRKGRSCARAGRQKKNADVHGKMQRTGSANGDDEAGKA